MRIGDERDLPLAGHQLAEQLDRSDLDADAGGAEHHVVDVLRGCVRDLPVERHALLVERAERLFFPRERAIAPPHVLPGGPRVDLDVDRQRILPQRLADSGARDRAAAERDHGGLPAGEPLDGRRLLEDAELELAAPREDLWNRLVQLALELAVEVDELASETMGELDPGGRLARAHEADEGDVAA